MKDQYNIVGPTLDINVKLEKEVVEILKLMETHTNFSAASIINTAMKRFITAHKDFLPPSEQKRANIHKKS